MITSKLHTSEEMYRSQMMNKLFAGRELRMVELKKRIKELEKTAGG